MFAAIACVMALPGCSSEDNCTTVNLQPEENATEIKLNVGVLGVAVRAPVSTNGSITVSSVVSTTDGGYTTNAWNSIVIFVVSPTSTSALSFSSARYYPANSLTTYIEGYCPVGTPIGKSVTFAADGTEGVMITAQASGTKATATSLSFIFDHLLTQLQFKFVSSMGYPAPGVNVVSLVIKQQKAPATLDLNIAVMTHTTKDLTLSGTFPIITAGVIVGNYPMVKSGEVPSVAVTASDGVTYPGTAIPITTEAGKSHPITLTFTPKKITAAISVTAWQVGE